MHNYYPLLLVGGIIGTISLLLLIAYGLVKDKKEAMGFERNMKDSEIMHTPLLIKKSSFSWAFSCCFRSPTASFPR